MDDNYVTVEDEKYMKALYGCPTIESQAWPTAYMLIYDSRSDE
jgi:hypothetical protein